MDFWRRMCFDLREFGYYQIIQVIGGPNSMKYIYVKYDSELDFHDYMTLDEHNRIRFSCDLYSDIMAAIEDGSIMYFTAIDDCIKNILMDVYKKGFTDEQAERLFKLIAMRIHQM